MGNVSAPEMKAPLSTQCLSDRIGLEAISCKSSSSIWYLIRQIHGPFMRLNFTGENGSIHRYLRSFAACFFMAKRVTALQWHLESRSPQTVCDLCMSWSSRWHNQWSTPHLTPLQFVMVTMQWRKLCSVTFACAKWTSNESVHNLHGFLESPWGHFRLALVTHLHQSTLVSVLIGGSGVMLTSRNLTTCLYVCNQHLVLCKLLSHVLHLELPALLELKWPQAIRDVLLHLLHIMHHLPLHGCHVPRMQVSHFFCAPRKCFFCDPHGHGYLHCACAAATSICDCSCIAEYSINFAAAAATS